MHWRGIANIVVVFVDEIFDRYHSVWKPQHLATQSFQLVIEDFASILDGKMD
jgi:hypothetical protein